MKYPLLFAVMVAAPLLPAFAQNDPSAWWVEHIDNRAKFESFARVLALPSASAPLSVPAVIAREWDRSIPEVIFFNSNIFSFHLEFLGARFPERVSGYDLRRWILEERQGRIHGAEIIEADPGRTYGLTFDFLDWASAEPRELERVFRIVEARFHAGSLAFFPLSRTQLQLLDTLAPLSFPVSSWLLERLADARPFAQYLTGRCYGRIRIILGDDPQGSLGAGLSWQDIPVFEGAPWDIESIVAGAIVGDPVAALSHLSLRLTARGTPHAYVRDAVALLGAYDGQLVRLDVLADRYELTAVEDPEEAAAWWAQNRPRATGIAEADESCGVILSLDAIADLGPLAEARYGAKAANLARARKLLGGDRVVPGFAIPMAYYFGFIETNAIKFIADGVLRSGSYADYLAYLPTDDRFVTDPSHREGVLAALQKEARKHGETDPVLVESIRAAIRDAFGVYTTVRFRSSSNAEDALEFSGAGLYDSTSVCALDGMDEDDAGPSHCDAREEEERTIDRGLKRVWTSLWNFRAQEEREYYQIPLERTGMAILVTPAFPDEAANGVATTGDPAALEDGRFRVAVQLGDASVVRPEPGIYPEVDLLTLSGGRVVKIERTNASSLCPPGAWVLSEGQLEELGEVLGRIQDGFFVETSGYVPNQVRLDVEFKFTAAGALIVKQVRPLLVAGSHRPEPPASLGIRVPPGAALCAGFVEGRTIEDALRFPARLALREGVWSLPVEPGAHPLQWIEALETGPARFVPEPSQPGQANLDIASLGGDSFSYEYTLRQVMIEGETTIDVHGGVFTFRVDAGIPESAELAIIPGQWSGQPVFETTLEGRDGVPSRFESCRCDDLPLREIRIDLDEGSIVLDVRQRRTPSPGVSGPTRLVHASIILRDWADRTSEPSRLVYAAGSGNTNEEFGMLLHGEPTGAAALVVRMKSPEQADRARLVDPGLDTLRDLTIRSTDAFLLSSMPIFLRQDVDGDGEVALSDAMRILWYLFAQGEAIPCPDAADANDDGRLTVSDAVAVVRHIFGADGDPRPEAFRCGEDPTEDDLPPCEYPWWTCP
ncbi:MAG: hypothetical protein JXP34_20080 [Planctomycetes bacterium]|nr:hypothetical protein [Planctomycetota bacterium]